MVNYSQYVVNPMTSMISADSMNLRRNTLAQNERQANTRNALNNRRLDMADKQNAFSNSIDSQANQRAQDQSDMLIKGKQREITRMQFETMGRIFDSMNDEKSFNHGMQALNGLVEAGMLDPKVVSKAPKSYDPSAIAKGKQMINSILPKVGSKYTIKQSETGEYVYMPDQPGRSVRSGIKGPSSNNGGGGSGKTGMSTEQIGKMKKDAMSQIKSNLGMDTAMFNMTTDDRDKHASYMDTVDVLAGSGMYEDPVALANEAIKIESSADRYAEATVKPRKDGKIDKIATRKAKKKYIDRVSKYMTQGFPDPFESDGRTIVNDKTGERLKAINGEWVDPIKAGMQR